MLIYNFDSLTSREVRILKDYIRTLTKRYWIYAGVTAIILLVLSYTTLGISGIVLGLPLNFLGWGVLFTHKFLNVLRDMRERVKVVGTAVIKEIASPRLKKNLVLEINGTKVFDDKSFSLLDSSPWEQFSPGDKVYVEYARHSKLILSYIKSVA